MKKIYYIYSLIDDTNKIVYIGCSTKPVERFYSHVKRKPCATKRNGTGYFYGRTDLSLRILFSTNNKSKALLAEGKHKELNGFVWSEKAKTPKKQFNPIILSNGDTVKQLLARSRYVLYKKKKDWKPTQLERAELLFKLYPDIEKAYELSQKLSWIFENSKDKLHGTTRLALWHEKVRQAGFKSFNTISRTIENHYQTILNYFDNRSTNASAESFNAKVKAFRSQFRGVKNIEFFLFRLTNIYA